MEFAPSLTMVRKSPFRALPLTGLALVVGGLILLSWLAWSLMKPSEPLYRYTLQTQGGADLFPELGLTDKQDLRIKKFSIDIDGAERPAAYAYIGESETSGPVLLQWDNQVTEPLLYTDSKIAEAAALADRIGDYVTDKTEVLGWWDVSQKLMLLCKCNPVITGHLRKPLLLPEIWQSQLQAVEQVENAYWLSIDAAEQDKLQVFADALLMDEQQAAVRLRELTGGRSSLLVLHITDAFKLGVLRPEGIGIGYKDFPDTGDMHGMIQRVKEWLSGKGYKHYIVERRGEAMVRVYFLTTSPTPSQPLITRLLPFRELGPTGLSQFSLVDQLGGYWVYRLGGKPPEG